MRKYDMDISSPLWKLLLYYIALVGVITSSNYDHDNFITHHDESDGNLNSTYG